MHWCADMPYHISFTHVFTTYPAKTQSTLKHKRIVADLDDKWPNLCPLTMELNLVWYFPAPVTDFARLDGPGHVSSSSLSDTKTSSFSSAIFAFANTTIVSATSTN